MSSQPFLRREQGYWSRFYLCRTGLCKNNNMSKRHTGVAFLGLLLLGSTLFGQTDPRERAISEVRMGFPSGAVAGSARVAAHGDTFLTVWLTEARGGQATRIDALGRPVQTTPLALPLAPLYPFWHDRQWFVLGAQGWVRLSEEGALLDTQPRPYDAPAFTFLDAVWSGRSLFVLAYSGAEPQRVLTLYTFDGDLKLKNSYVFSGLTTPAAAIQSDGQTTLVFHSAAAGSSPVVAALFDGDGAFLRQRILFEPEKGDRRSILSVGSRGGGSGYTIVAWTPPPRMFPAIYSAYELAHDLVPASPVALGAASAAVVAGTMPWDGNALTFFISDFGHLAVIRIGSGGVKGDSAGAEHPPQTEVLDLEAASLPGATLLVESALAPGTGSLGYAAVRAGSTAEGIAAAQPVPLDTGGAEQLSPAAASSATQSLVTWREGTVPAQAFGLFATRVAPDGTVLDPRSIRIADSICPNSRAAVGAIGGDFLVGWNEGTGLQLATVSADGRVERQQPLHREQRCFPRSPLIIAGSEQALVIWFVPSVNFSRVLAARVRRDGTLIDSLPLNLGLARGAVYGASNGSDYLITWDNNFTRVTAGGTVLDPSGDSFLGVSTSVSAAWWNGTTWSVLHGDSGEQKITRIDGRGRVTATGATIRPPEGWSLSSADSSACDASGCSLVMGATGGTPALRELRATDDGVTAALALRDPQPIVSMVAPSSPSKHIAALRTPGGRLFAAYARRDLSHPASGALRIFLRPMESSPRIRGVRR